MIRIVFFLIAVALIAFGIAEFADRPGDVAITWPWLERVWPGHGHVDTSLMALAGAVLATMAAIAILWAILRAILRSPFAMRAHLRRRRGERAYEAISRGLLAVGSGDLAAARKHTAEARRLAPAEPLSLLLHAQAAQLGGDRATADDAFRAMANRPDTKALGLRGLFIEAQRRGDKASAHAFAEEAARDNPSLSWAGRAVLEFRCLTGDWAGALALLEQQKPALDKEAYKRQRAVLLTAHALAVEDTDREAAKTYALEAVKLAPTLVPAAALAGRVLAETGELRKASRIVHNAWVKEPHPELAEVLANLRFGDAARDRLKRIEALAKRVPGHIEGALATARAAMSAQEFAKARAALADHLKAPTRRVALLMAELERAEHNDEGRAREWIARAVNAAPDPVWTADGHVSDRWLPASPVTGRLDAVEWRVPLAGSLSAPSVIEPERPVAPATLPIAIEAAPIKTNDTPAPVVGPLPEATFGTPSAPEIAKPDIAKPDIRSEIKAEPIIPLVHAPDDPGPDAPVENEPRVEPESAWRKIFG
jgi:HemY protein